MLRTDNNLEFCNKQFTDLCKTSRILIHETYIDTPLQNGLAKRMNRTILEKVRCMLANSGLSKRFWAEVVSTTCYLINMSPSFAINFKTPMKFWSYRPHKLNHLRTFSCLAYIHVNKGKLNPRALRVIFLGHPIGTKVYKVWLIDEFKCIVSRDVVFNETLFNKDLFNSNNKQSKYVRIEVEQSNFDRNSAIKSCDGLDLGSNPIRTLMYEDKGLNQQPS